MVNLISTPNLILLAMGHHKVSFACDDVRAPSIHMNLTNLASLRLLAYYLYVVRNGHLLILDPARSKVL